LPLRDHRRRDRIAEAGERGMERAPGGPVGADGKPAPPGGAIATTVLTAWEDPRVKPVGITLLKSAIGGSAAGGLVRQFLVRELGSQIAGRLAAEGVEATEADLRASLVLAQMAGALIVRHVVVLEPLASVPLDEVIARVGPALQGHIDGRGG
ncbi:hypothetical protein DN540_42265, partial [Burkholderia multivorans]